MKMKRICVYPKDVMVITGRGIRYSRNIIKEIKTHLNKSRRQPVTIKEFCDYMGFEVEEVEEIVSDS